MACYCSFALPADAISHTPIIFIGQVTKTKKGLSEITVTQYWKMPLPKSVKVIDLSAKTNCAANFEKGQRYIFFVEAATRQGENIYQRRACTLTTKIGQTIGFVDGTYSTLEQYVEKQLGKGKNPN